MSALPRKRTSDRLFNHLVGGHLHDLRHCEVQRLGGLEVDHELEFGGLHDRQVGGFLTLQNPAGVDADLTIGIGEDGPVTHQATSHDKFAQVIGRRQRIASCERDELLTAGGQERAGTDEQRTGPALHERYKGCFDVAVVPE